MLGLARRDAIASALVDRVVTFFSLAAGSMPELLVRARRHPGLCRGVGGWLPTSGSGTPAAWVLPVATLSLGPIGVLTQVVRGAMIDVLTSGYVRNARARGFSSRRLVYRHALQERGAADHLGGWRHRRRHGQRRNHRGRRLRLSRASASSSSALSSTATSRCCRPASSSSASSVILLNSSST